MEQRIEVPNVEDVARIEAQRKWVREHYEPDSQHEYESLDGKLRLLHTIISSGWVEPHETVKLQCLGIALGDALVQELNMRWISVEDDQGRDPAIELPGTSVVLFPLTMIAKRIERGEVVDVYEIFSGVCTKIQELAMIADRRNET
jgi:hypothetical protein